MTERDRFRGAFRPILLYWLLAAGVGLVILLLGVLQGYTFDLRVSLIIFGLLAFGPMFWITLVVVVVRWLMGEENI